MSLTYQIIRGCLILVFFCLALGWFFWRSLKNSHDPALLIFRWLLTAATVAVLTYASFKSRQQLQAGNKLGAMIVLYAAIAGLVLAGIWVPVVTGAVGRLFGNLYDGGSQEIEPKPFYSIFKSKRQNGKYYEALAEIRRQLDKFPKDFEGQMLLAELQAENLNDLPGAAVTIERACSQPDQTPLNISFALNKLADWHLGLTKDRDAAQQTLEHIMELLPDSDLALRAAQRIASLADSEMLLAPHDRQRIEVKRGVQNLGLHRGENGRLQAPEVDQEKLAAEYVTHLERHPLDAHAREKLAVIYAKHYHRLDLAIDQLEQLVQQPNHVAKQVAHWLNLIADLQVREGATEEQVRATLQRVLDLYPDSVSAQTTQRRMDMLKLEFKANVKGHDVQLGTYEQNIGLKRSRKPSAD